MKTIKYLVAGLLLASLSVPAMAQTSQADIDAITKVIVDAKGDAVATKDQVKEFKKAHKKDAVALAALGRAFLEAKNYQMAEEIANLAIKLTPRVQRVTSSSATSLLLRTTAVRLPVSMSRVLIMSRLTRLHT